MTADCWSPAKEGTRWCRALGFSIRVDLVEGHGQRLWPRPGRIFAAARTHTFAQLARAIDDTFARWDRASSPRVPPRGRNAADHAPSQPLPYFGWGDVLDQYGRRWDNDDGERPQPKDPGLADLPPLKPWWGVREGESAMHEEP